MLAFLLLQAATPSVPDLVMSGGIAGLVLYFWRQDRVSREEERKRDQERYAALAADFRIIVQDNTAAVTSLRDMIKQQDELSVRKYREMRTLFGPDSGTWDPPREKGNPS